MSQPLMTFKQALDFLLSEDLQPEIDKLVADISMIDTQLAQRTNPLQQRKAALTKLLAQKQAQLQAQNKRAPSTTSQHPTNPMTATTQTRTPGSAGAATPGGSSQSM